MSWRDSLPALQERNRREREERRPLVERWDAEALARRKAREQTCPVCGTTYDPEAQP
jgi:hypothetical protein